jgi:hypothetical protein
MKTTVITTTIIMIAVTTITASSIDFRLKKYRPSRRLGLYFSRKPRFQFVFAAAESS